MNGKIKKEKSYEPKHAKFSPSSSFRWMSCTKSLELPHAPDKSNESARRGTALHLFCELMLQGKKIEKDTFLEHGISEEDFDNITAEDIETIVNPYIDYVKALNVDHYFLEQRVKLSDTCWGSVDFLGYEEETKTLHVVDLKTGSKGFVVNEENKQLAIYAIGGVNFMRSKGFTVEKIFTHIVQSPMNNISCVEVLKSDLNIFRREVLDVVEKVMNGDTEFMPNSTNCKYCPAAINCPELLAMTKQVCREDFENRELAEKMDLISVLEFYVEKVKNSVKSALSCGERVGDYELQPMYRRRFKDEKLFISRIKALGLENEIYEPAKLYSPSKIEKTFKLKRIDMELDSYIEKSHHAYKIVKKNKKSNKKSKK